MHPAHRMIVGVIAVFAASCGVLAQTVSPAPPGQPATGRQGEPTPEAPALGMVLGKPLTLDDLRPSTSTLKRMVESEKLEGPDQWMEKHRGELLKGAIFSALVERYIKDHRLEATEAELDEFARVMQGSTEMADALARIGERLKKQAADLRKKLANPKLAEADRAQLTEELTALEAKIKEHDARASKTDWPTESERREMGAQADLVRERLNDKNLSPADRKELEDDLGFKVRFQDLTEEQAAKEWKKFNDELMRRVGKDAVYTWKLYRALHKQYGARIIFQQAGIEPIDALRKWLEDREKAGDFAIHDPALKESFWHYFKQEHQLAVEEPTGREFDKPFWLLTPVK